MVKTRHSSTQVAAGKVVNKKCSPSCIYNQRALPEAADLCQEHVNILRKTSGPNAREKDKALAAILLEIRVRERDKMGENAGRSANKELQTL